MLGGWLHPGRCPIGIDVGSHSVKLIQLDRTGGGAAVLAAASRPLPEGLKADSEAYHEAVTQAVAGAYRAAPFRGREVVSALPSAAVHYKNLRLPKMPPEDMAQAVRWEARDRLGLGQKPCLIQHYDAGEVRQGEELRREVIVLAAPSRFVDQHVRSLTGAALTPIAIDAIPGALLRCFDRGQIDDDDPRVVIDAGYEGTKVLIFRGRQILFFKQIPIGGRALDEAVAAQLGLPQGEAAQARRRLTPPPAEEEEGGDGCAPAPDDSATTAPPLPAPRESEPVEGEAAEGGAEDLSHVHRAVYEAIRPKVSELAREVGLCLRYYSVTFRGRRPETAVLVGGESDQPWLAPMLSEYAGITVRPGGPFGWVDLARVSATIPDAAAMSRWGVAAGLSLRSLRANARLQKKEAAA